MQLDLQDREKEQEMQERESMWKVNLCEVKAHVQAEEEKEEDDEEEEIREEEDEVLRQQDEVEARRAELES